MSNQSSKRGQFHRSLSTAALVAGCFWLAGCSGQIIKQGHQFQDADVAQVREGMGKDQVVLALGTPDTQSTSGGGSYYYISTIAQQRMAFMAPEITDRRVVAVYFNNKDKVERIANYGMKDGKVFDFVKRETPTYSHDQGILKELFRNIGSVGPAIPGAR